MTELESKLLMADAVVDIIKTCEPKQKDFWAEKKRLGIQLFFLRN